MKRKVIELHTNVKEVCDSASLTVYLKDRVATVQRFIMPLLSEDLGKYETLGEYRNVSIIDVYTASGNIVCRDIRNGQVLGVGKIYRIGYKLECYLK